MSLLFKASSPAALSSIAEGDAGGEADADGGGNSSPQQAQKQQQRGSTGNRSSTSSAADEAEEHSRRQRAHAGRGRRQVVFSEPVRLDAEWHPVLVPKSQQQREEIAGVMRQNILFAGGFMSCVMPALNCYLLLYAGVWRFLVVLTFCITIDCRVGGLFIHTSELVLD